MISFFPPPSETHLSAHTQHLLFTRGDHVSVNHAGATLPSEKSNKLQRWKRVVGRGTECFSSFICFRSPSIPSRLRRNCCQQVPRSIKHPVLGYKQIPFCFLMAQVDLDAFEFFERQHVLEQVKEHSKEIQSKFCCSSSLSLSVREPCADLTAKRTN